MKNMLRNKTFGFYLGFIASLSALIMDAFYIISDFGDKTFSIVAFLLILLGSICGILVLFTDFQFMQLLASVLISAGVGFIISVTIPTITDIFNGVVFIGGNQSAAVLFLITFLLCGIVSNLSCYFDKSKDII
jgi:hypothetical protein